MTVQIDTACPHTSNPTPAHTGRPQQPARDPSLSADGQYFVLPYAVLAKLPVPVQHQVAAALAQVHQHAPQQWPIYQVTPTRWTRLRDLNEDELRAHGVLVELDIDGELVYRDLTTGKKLADADLDRMVLAPCSDPLRGRR